MATIAMQLWLWWTEPLALVTELFYYLVEKMFNSSKLHSVIAMGTPLKKSQGNMNTIIQQ